MLIPFGFFKDNTGTIRVDNTKAETIQLIFELYSNGFSLKRITEHLAEKHVFLPTGKDKWTVQAIDNLLSNEKYLHIIPFEQFVKAQLEKQKRSNITSDHTRKTARYHSENVLSGLLVCGECGKISDASLVRTVKFSGGVPTGLKTENKLCAKICIPFLMRKLRKQSVIFLKQINSMMRRLKEIFTVLK